MHAIEFRAKVTNGSITIPAQYRNEVKGNVRVILLTEERPQDFDMIGHLLANPLNIAGFTPFKREEIYEQR